MRYHQAYLHHDPGRRLGACRRGQGGELNFFMYSTRDAVTNLAKLFTNIMVAMGFVKTKASPCSILYLVKNATHHHAL